MPRIRAPSSSHGTQRGESTTKVTRLPRSRSLQLPVHACSTLARCFIRRPSPQPQPPPRRRFTYRAATRAYMYSYYLLIKGLLQALIHCQALLIYVVYPNRSIAWSPKWRWEPRGRLPCWLRIRLPTDIGKWVEPRKEACLPMGLLCFRLPPWRGLEALAPWRGVCEGRIVVRVSPEHSSLEDVVGRGQDGHRVDCHGLSEDKRIEGHGQGSGRGLRHTVKLRSLPLRASSAVAGRPSPAGLRTAPEVPSRSPPNGCQGQGQGKG